MKEYEQRVIEVIMVPKGEPIFSEAAYSVKIVDDAAGEFVLLQGTYQDTPGQIAVDPDQWPDLRAVIDDAFKRCRK